MRVSRLNRGAIDAFSKAEVSKAMSDIAFSINTSTSEEFAALLRRDLDRWGPVVKSTGFRSEE
jgi:tripartite-type tricarboxylate transporter receptor subunit TctC